MRKRALVAVLLVALCAVVLIVPDVLAKPQSMLTKVLAGLSKEGTTVVEIRRDKDEKSFDAVLLKDDKLSVVRLPDSGPRQELTPQIDVPVDKIKALGGWAEKAQQAFVDHPPLAKTKVYCLSVTLINTKDGKLMYSADTYLLTDHRYRKSYIVDPATWKVVREGKLVVDPRNLIWSKEDAERAKASPETEGAPSTQKEEFEAGRGPKGGAA